MYIFITMLVVAYSLFPMLLAGNMSGSSNYVLESLPHAYYDNTMSFSLGIESKEVADIDIKIVTAILSQINSKVTLKYVNFDQPVSQLLRAGIDMVPYHTQNIKDGDYIFSAPYRDEIYSVFTMNNSKFKFADIDELMNLLRLRKFRLGIIENRLYHDDKINQLIQKYSTIGLVYKYSNDAEALTALSDGSIEGWISTAFAGITTIADSNLIDKINQIIVSRKSISLIFNTKTLPLSLIADLKKEIVDFGGSRTHYQVINSYIDRFLLTKYIGSRCFVILSVIGTIAFTVSGIMLATRKNASLFGTILLALIPSFIASVALHIVLGLSQRDVLGHYMHVYINIIIILIVFFFLRLIGEETSSKLFNNITSDVIVVCDTLGQAIFMIPGIAVASVVRFYPLVLWGPIFTLVFSVGGCIIRNILCKRDVLKDVYYEVGIWVTLAWSCILAFILEFIYELVYNVHTLNLIQYAATGSILGAFWSRILLTYYFNVRSIRLFGENHLNSNGCKNFTKFNTYL